MRRLKVGIIGGGAVAQIMHLPYLQELDDYYQVVALCDVSAPTLEAVGDYFGIQRRHIDCHQLLKEDIDAVLILSSGSHLAPAVAAAQAGKHILVEKPITFTVSEADAVIAAAKQARVKLMVAYMKRYDPGYRYGREAVLKLKDLEYVQITVLHPAIDLYWAHHRIRRTKGLPKPKERLAETLPEAIANVTKAVTQGEEARLIAETLGPDAPLEQQVALYFLTLSSCHDVNALRGILGNPQTVRYTDVWNSGACFTSLLEYASGLRVNYSWIMLPELRDYRQDLGFYGSSGRVIIQFPSPFLRNMPTPVMVQGMEGEASWEKQVIVNYEEAFKEELRHFYNCVVNNKEPLTTGEDAREDLKLLRQMALAYRR
ncbi:MAG: Gfo/Idh/MocA family oxidoreductase [Deinococcus sp.]|nr:Gfo/Idh/MocA family oxidoreductase [Deinococcus sp.]